MTDSDIRILYKAINDHCNRCNFHQIIGAAVFEKCSKMERCNATIWVPMLNEMAKKADVYFRNSARIWNEWATGHKENDSDVIDALEDKFATTGSSTQYVLH